MSKKSRKSKYCVSTQVFVSLLALVLVMGVAVGGTIAWLTATTDEVVNTFTTSDIKVELKETKTNFKMIPGYTIEKDPKATVLTGSEECWLFVKLEKSTNFDSYLTYEMADGWTLVEGQTNVYARKVESADIGTAYSVLKNDQVSVKGEVTKTMMNGLTVTNDDGTTTNNYPTLTITAYASQLHKNASEDFTAAQAWANIG